MAEATNFKFSYKELAALMVKQQQIKEGHWGVVISFGLTGGNAGPTPEQVVPAAIVGVLEIGLRRFDAPGPLTVDAATVWSK